MAIADGTAGAWVAGTTRNQTVTLPSHSTGEMLLVRVGWKSATPTTDVAFCNTSGWAKIGQFYDGQGVSANGGGGVLVAVFWKVATSGAETNPVIEFDDATAPNPGCWSAVTYTKGAGESWATPVGDGGAVAAATSYSGTIQSHVTAASGDMLDAFFVSNDNTTLTVPTVTQAGLTLDTVTEYPATALSSATGNDCSADGCNRRATAGTSSAAAVVSGTNSVADTGAAWVTRLRVSVATDAPAGLASSTGAAGDIDASIAPAGGLASATATANNATVTTGKDVDAGLASATGSAGGVNAAVAANTIAAVANAGAAIVKDVFGRTLTDTLGSADTGGAYVEDNANTDVGAGFGIFTNAASTRATGVLDDVSAKDIDAVIQFQADKVPADDDAWFQFFARLTHTPGDDYEIFYIVNGGTVRLMFAKQEGGVFSVLGSIFTVTRETFIANQQFHARFQVQGTNPVELRAKIWRGGTAQPTSWDHTFSDSSPSSLLQAAGIFGIRTEVEGISNGPITWRLSDLFVTDLVVLATPSVAPAAGAVAVSGAANDATVQTSAASTDANAEVATATGTANGASASVDPNAGIATGTGAAGHIASSVAPTAGLAEAAGTSHDPTLTVTGDASATADIATASGAAYDASAEVSGAGGRHAVGLMRPRRRAPPEKLPELPEPVAVLATAFGAVATARAHDASIVVVNDYERAVVAALLGEPALIGAL